MATSTRTRRGAETSAAAEAVAGNPPAQRPAAKKAPAKKTAPAPQPVVVEVKPAAPAAPAKKSAAKKSPAKKVAALAAVPAPVPAPAEKTAAKKPASVKAAAGKSAAAKPAAAKKTAAKTPAPVSEPARKSPAAKKVAAPAPAAKKAAAKKPPAAKAPAAVVAEASPPPLPPAPIESARPPAPQAEAPAAAPARPPKPSPPRASATAPAPAPARTPAHAASGRAAKPAAKPSAKAPAQKPAAQNPLAQKPPTRQAAPEHRPPPPAQPRRPAPAPAPVEPPPIFAWQRPEADEVFAAIALRDLRDGSEYTLDLRSATPGDNRCSCAAWRSAVSGQCEHLAFVLAQLAADSETAAVLEHGWQPLHSEVFLRYGARRSLRWLAGSICPEPLEQAALALLDPRGDLRLDDGAALPALLRLADEVGQELRVDESVWTHLAHQRDAANRVLRLEQAYPEGPSSAALQSLLTLPLRPYQIEGALFAAVAGHALLADDDGLGKTVQAVAATELLIRQFGVERVLVACEAAQQPHWQQALQELAGRGSLRVEGDAASRAAHYADAAPIKIADLATLRQDRAGLAAFNPELVIVDEARDEARAEQPFDFAVLDGLGVPYALLITRTPLEERPQDLLPRVLWLDPYRLGTSARFLRQHVKRSAGGEIAGIAALEQLDTTLRHVMLRRTRDQVSAQLPESVDVPWPVALTPEQRARHDEAAAPAAPILARWQRSAYVSDADQRRLVAALRQMQDVCHGAGTEAPPKLDALLGLLPELLERPDTRVVVFSARTQTALQAGRRLGAAGFDHVVFGASDAIRQRLQGSAAYRVVLCSDAASDPLPAQPLKTVVIQLDPPCDPQRRQRRLQRVQGDAPARNLPVIQLIAQDSLEAALWALPAEARELVASTIDGQRGEAFLQGERLAQFMAVVAALLQGLARH